MNVNEPRVTMKHCRALGFCASGLRSFTAKHGISWRRLLDEGIPVSELEHIDDAMLKQVIALAKES